jgi:two-component system NtrC family sensor kinase
MSTHLRDDISWLGNATCEEMQRVVEALYRVHRLIAAMTDTDALLLRIIEESRQVAQAEASSLVLYDADRDDLYFHVAVGESGDQQRLMKEIRLQMGQGIAGTAAASRTSIKVEDAQQDPRFYSGADDAIQFQTRNLLAVPLIDRENLVGVLEVVNKIGGESFSQLDLRVLEMFSSLAATSIANARLIQEQIRTERLAAIGQAVTGLSHHTKNIVTGLSGSADLIDMGLQQRNAEVLNRAWPVFRRSVKRISEFVQDMLSFSKERVPVREECEVAHLLTEAYDTYAELFARQELDVKIDAHGVTGPIYADPQGLYRCLVNLLMNAAEAVPRPGGRIRITACTRGDQVEIVVQDNGPGVPEENRKKIFDPFFSTKGAQGTGLGLAVTAKIIHEHGGELSLENSPEGGAAFHILLPTHMPAQRALLEI